MNLRFSIGWALITLATMAPSVEALGPHECAIIVNRQSRDSVALANFYADLRGIPPVNMLHLDIPQRFTGAGAGMTPAEFRQYIYEPVVALLMERQLHSHILVWLYSLDFPVLITTDPPMSLTGLTFTRGQPPAGEDIQSGLWRSPLYRGPDKADGPASPPISMEHFAVHLTTNMPLPAMMLGWSGSRGMTVEAIQQQLRRSATTDASQPSASVFFDVHDDIRSTTRQWQFEPANRELTPLGILAHAGAEPSRTRTALMGVMAGRAIIHAPDFGALTSGAYADHLTSFGAIFDTSEQTKITEWLRHGAAGTAGTVTEPGSLTVPTLLWPKFPTARLFVHYGAGCTLIESLYQSVRSPLQLLPMGDALAAPWAKPPGITLISMADDEDKPLSGKAEFMASTWGGFGQAPPVTVFLLDGRPVQHPGNQPLLGFDTTRLYDGHHELRVIAYANESVRHQGFAIREFSVRNRGRDVTLGGYAQRQEVDLYRPLIFQITAEPEPQEVAIVAQERILTRGPYTNGVTLSVPAMLVGAGPVAFQAVAVYDGKEPVRSAPLHLNIQPLNQPPRLTGITITTNEPEVLTVTAAAEDPEGDTTELFWYADALALTPTFEAAPLPSRGAIRREGNALILHASNDWFAALTEIDQPNRIKELRTTFRVLDDAAVDTPHQATLVFNYRDADNFMAFGMNGRQSSWMLVRFRDGVADGIFSKGAPIENGRDYTLTAAVLNDRQLALLVDDDVLGVVDAAFGPGKVGVRTRTAPVRFNHLFVAPPSALTTEIRPAVGGLSLPETRSDLLPNLHAVARDMQWTVIQPVLGSPGVIAPSTESESP
ncbi:MAG TPA: hypothetical protein PKA51_07115 [Kiritimatiellia bacterium]|nr:hypothetical protein [Kiritimatiellia bacterium]